MSYIDWTPKRGAPTTALAKMFDLFYDANRLGLGDGEAAEGVPDESGNGRRSQGVTQPVTQNDPSTLFGAANASLQVGNIVTINGAYTDEGTASGDLLSRSIPPVVGETADTEQPVTLVLCAAVTAYALPTVLPLDDAGNVDNTGWAFGQTGGFFSVGTYAGLAASSVAADTDAHLFIMEFGTATSGLEVDGVDGGTSDLTGSGHVPSNWVLAPTQELLFFGAVLGTLSDSQRQLIRGWVTANTPIVIA